MVLDAVGNPQTILLLGGTSEIGLAICERYLRDAPARIILAALPGDPGREDAVAQLVRAGAKSVTLIDFDALDTAGSELAELDRAFLAKLKDAAGQTTRRYQVVLSLYDLVNQQLPRKLDEVKMTLGAAPAAPATPATPALAKVEKDLATAAAALDRVLTQVGKEDRLSKTCALGTYALQAAARAQRYQVIIATIHASPKVAEVWADFVQAQSRPNEMLERPEIPLMAVDKQFATKYDPAVVAGIFESNTALQRALKGSGDTLTVLDQDALSDEFATLKPGFEAYLAGYSTYWARGASDELKFAGKTWKEFAGALQNVSERIVRNRLKEYGDKMAAALDKINDQPNASQVRLALSPLAKKDFQDECGDVLDRWKELGEDPVRARRTLLGLTASKFIERYTAISARGLDGLAARYWSALAVESVRMLANDGQAEVSAGLAELAKYDRFPLAPLMADKVALTAAQVAAARQALRSVVGVLEDAPVGEAGETLGLGGRTHDKALDEQLERLRGQNLLAGKEKYLKRLSTLLKGLPEADKTLQAAVVVIKEKLKDPDSLNNVYAHLVISQANKELGVCDLRAMTSDHLDKITYPGETLKLGLRKIPNGPIDKTILVDGPWAALRLLHLTAAKRNPKDPHKWTVELPVTDEAGKKWSVWLEVEYDQELPDLSDWPAGLPAKNP